jgi:hypothetical protein
VLANGSCVAEAAVTINVLYGRLDMNSMIRVVNGHDSVFMDSQQVSKLDSYSQLSKYS